MTLATADVQSGVEITIPFTMGGDALADEYELSAESIVIAPNATLKYYNKYFWL